MPWLQLRIDTQRDYADQIEDEVLAAGAVSVTLQDNADQPILEPALGETPLWQETRITGLFDADISTQAVDQQLQAALPQHYASHQWEQLEDKDWEREWMKNYQPIQCGDNLWVCPSWLEPPNPNSTNLMLDPGLAFGTGTHPTTFLCLQWIDQQPWQQQQVIDYGCGSGILGIATLLKGAQRVLGIDIDPQALVATQDNAQRNGLAADAMPVYLPDAFVATKPQPANVVLANILAGPLAELAPQLTQLTRIGGKLCLSGILANQADTVMRAYQAHFEFEPVAQKEEWVRLCATRIA